jgi:hypothetical protein
MARRWRWTAVILAGFVLGTLFAGASSVAAAPGQLAIAYAIDPVQPVVGLPTRVTAAVSAVGGPLTVALVRLFPVSATADATGQTITATVTAAPNGPGGTYTGTLTFPAPGTWHLSSPNWQGAPGGDLAVTVGDTSLAGLPACRAGDLTASAQWEAAVGNRYGTVTMTNHGTIACILPPYPAIQIEDGQGNLAVPRGDAASGMDAGGDTAILPGQQAQLAVRWANFCPQAAADAAYNLRVFLSGDPTDSFTVSASAPPCLGEAEPSLLSVQAVALQGDAVQVVRDYIAAINNRQYDAAYALLGAAMRRQNPSPDAFAAGFALTARDDLHVIAAGPDDDQTVVTIHLTARQRDGARWNFHGTYTIGPEDGALKILAANIAQD